MSELRFTVLEMAPEPYAVAPNLLARLRIEELSGELVHAMALRAQVRIEPRRRRYDDLEEQGLTDLFGTRERWADTMQSFCWMHATAMVPGFTGSTEVSLVLPCSYDVEVAGAKYLQSLADGEIPLTLLFSGTLFTRRKACPHCQAIGSTGFAVEQIPWQHEASYRLPVEVWRRVMAEHFPGQGWIRVDQETLAALARYRSSRLHTSWEEALSALLAAAGTGPAGTVAR
jgi:hypothetical protein